MDIFTTLASLNFTQVVKMSMRDTHLVLDFLLVLVVQRVFLLIWVSSDLNTHKITHKLKHDIQILYFLDPVVTSSQVPKLSLSPSQTLTLTNISTRPGNLCI